MSTDQNPIAFSEVRTLRSAHVGDEFKLFIAHPVLPHAPGQKLPVIYVLDGNGSFGLATDIVRFLQPSGEVPNAYVVGIGYRKASFGETVGIRMRDFTPVKSPVTEQYYGVMTGSSEPVVTGGTTAFLRFVRDELKPYIAREFAAHPADATIAGVSGGGTCATWALLTDPSLFQRYIICSPDLFYENEALSQQEAKYAATHRDLNARVFLASGALETEALSTANLAGKMPPEMFKALKAIWPRGYPAADLQGPFADRLRSRNYPNLSLTTHLFPDEHHTSVYPSALTRGLRVVFARGDG